MRVDKNHPGYLIVYVMVFIVGLMSVGLVILSLVGTTYRFTQDDIHRKNASQMARACVSVVANELDEDSGFTDFPSSLATLYDRTAANGSKATCVIDSLTDGADSTKILEVTSFEYRYDGDPQPVEYNARAVLEAVDSGGDTTHLLGGMLVGYGGTYFNGSQDITTTRMNILGRVQMNGSSDITALSNGPVNVHNIACPLDGTGNWPEQCTASQPIDRGPFGDIYGDICAPGQITTTGLHSLNPSCTLPDIEMPSFNKAAFINGLSGPTITGSELMASGGTWGCRVGSVGRTITIPAGATIIGNINYATLPASLSPVCTIEFAGDAYITGGINGNIPGGQNLLVRFKVADTATENVTIVMNGRMTMVPTTGTHRMEFVPSSSGKLAHIINFHSTNASCSASTSTTCLTAAEAYASAFASSSSPTNAALDVNANNRGRDYTGMTFYAYYSIINPGCGNDNLRFAALAAQGLYCSGNGRFRLEATDPTFGIPVSAGSVNYRMIDFTQR